MPSLAAGISAQSSIAPTFTELSATFLQPSMVAHSSFLSLLGSMARSR